MTFGRPLLPRHQNDQNTVVSCNNNLKRMIHCNRSTKIFQKQHDLMFKQASISNPTNAILTGKGAAYFWVKAAAKGKSKSFF